MFDLHAKVALVTGGGRGIGRGIALALAAQGADVAVDYVSDPKDAQRVVGEMAAKGRKAVAVQGDVSKPADAERIVAETVKTLGRLDVLVNNAGILSFEPFLGMKEETWDRVIAVNLKGQFLVAQAAARQMVKQKAPGRIVNIASIASGQVGVGFAGIAHYTASKGGVIALTESMALELAPHGITANAIAPGAIETDMTKASLATPDGRRSFLSRIPAGRIGQPADIGAMAVFLASDESSYCTGATFYVDGGWLAG